MPRMLLSPPERKGDHVFINPSSSSPPFPLPFLPTPTIGFGSDSSTSSDGKINPTILLVILILAILFFLCGLTHLLLRFFSRSAPPSLFSLSSSTRHLEDYISGGGGGPDAVQRQLHHLFRLHDSGLDQAAIDALPVFPYKSILMGSKEPFDCAVCLSEFSDDDKLRLLPVCSHAFHLRCIDTWLLTSSTCPLCRSILDLCSARGDGSGSPWETQLLGGSDDYSGEMRNGVVDGRMDQKPTIVAEPESERRVYSVRLGKFRCVNRGEDDSGEAGQLRDSENGNGSTSSSSKLDGRRCYSMGSYEYVLGDLDLLVSLSHENAEVANGAVAKIENRGGQSGTSTIVIEEEEAEEGKRISMKSRGESFSVSKIWQWSDNNKGGRVPAGFAAPNSHMDVGGGGPVNDNNVGLPLTNKAVI